MNQRRRAAVAGCLIVFFAGFGQSAAALSTEGLPALPADDSRLTCYELANEISLLLQQQRGTPGFWARTDNQTAGVFTLIAPLPAIGYLGFNAYHDVKQDSAPASARHRVVELRRYSAQKQCFVQ
ncbi:MAG: hypothetical protein ACI8PT_000307 [Gammaproteobacteria bacterium]|jgi:hypothetical protein